MTDEVASVITDLRAPHHLGLAGWDLLITNRGGDSLSFVDTRTLERTGDIAVPGRPDIIAVSPNCDRAYVTLRDVVGVAVVDLVDKTYLDLIGFGQGELHGIALLPGTKAAPSPMFHQNARHTGQSSFIGPATGALKWSFVTGSESHGTPSVGADGAIYVTSHDGDLYAVSSEGNLASEKELHDE